MNILAPIGFRTEPTQTTRPGRGRWWPRRREPFNDVAISYYQPALRDDQPDFGDAEDLEWFIPGGAA